MFKNCNFRSVNFKTASSILGMKIDEKCSVFGAEVPLEAQASNLLSTQQISELWGEKFLPGSLIQIKYIALNIIEKEMNKQIDNSALNILLKLSVKSLDTDTIVILNDLKEEYVIHLVCCITYNNFATLKDNSSKICALMYNNKACINQIWLYDYNSLLKWFEKSNVCPLKNQITQIKFFNLDQILIKIKGAQ